MLSLLQVKIWMWTSKDMEIHEFFLILGYYEDIQNNVILSLNMDTTCEPSHYNIGFVIIMCMYHTLYINIKSMWDPQKGSQCIFAHWTYGAVITPPQTHLKAIWTRWARMSWASSVMRFRSRSCFMKLSSSEALAIQNASAPAMFFCFCNTPITATQTKKKQIGGSC